jgi:hypothetical protein
LSPPPSPPKTFLNLHYDAYSSANSHNGRTANCIPSFDAGDLDTEIKWTKLAWFNEDLLQIDALDTTYAITVSGSGKLLYSAPTVASAHDCAGGGSTRGEGVIDLRGTPYVIAGVSDTPCYQTNSGGTTSTCFQWKASGWYAAVRVTCSDGNQRCVVRCGGYSGGCSPINNILQLAWAPSSRFAVITATQNAEDLPYGPGPIGTKPAFFCTDCISSPSDSWTETVACDGSNVDMTIIYQFDSALSVVDRMRVCSATGCNVGFTVYGPGITTTSFNSDWWFTKGATVLTSTSGSRVSSDDGMWGGAPGMVNGNLDAGGVCYGNTGTTGFYGFGNCNAGDSQGVTVYYGPNGSKQCPSLKAQLYAPTPN